MCLTSYSLEHDEPNEKPKIHQTITFVVIIFLSFSWDNTWNDEKPIWFYGYDLKSNI